jgi:hypothetical protein
MTTKASKLGPGRLTFGAAGTTQEFGAQVTKVTLEPADGDSTAVLDGGRVTDGDYTLTGEFFQDYSSMTSLIVWCKTHAGQSIAWEYVPTTGEVLAAKGVCEISEVKFGGDVKKRNTTEFSFTGVGDYEYFDATGA